MSFYKVLMAALAAYGLMRLIESYNKLCYDLEGIKCNAEYAREEILQLIKGGKYGQSENKAEE